MSWWLAEIDATAAVIISSASGRANFSLTEDRWSIFIYLRFFLFFLFYVFIDLSGVSRHLEQKDLQAPFRRELIPVNGGSEERTEKNVCTHLWVWLIYVLLYVLLLFWPSRLHWLRLLLCRSADGWREEYRSTFIASQHFVFFIYSQSFVLQSFALMRPLKASVNLGDTSFKHLGKKSGFSLVLCFFFVFFLSNETGRISTPDAFVWLFYPLFLCWMVYLNGGRRFTQSSHQTSFKAASSSPAFFYFFFSQYSLRPKPSVNSIWCVASCFIPNTSILDLLPGGRVNSRQESCRLQPLLCPTLVSISV